MQPARRPVFFARSCEVRNKAIHTGTLDCFTLRVRNDVRDNLNCILLTPWCTVLTSGHKTGKVLPSRILRMCTNLYHNRMVMQFSSDNIPVY
jgi:hypothetical protein